MPGRARKQGYLVLPVCDVDRIKIAIFLPSFRGGGAEMILIRLASEFSRRGHDVKILVCDCSGPNQDMPGRGVTVVDMRKKKVRECLIPMAVYLFRNRPKVIMTTMVHCNTMLSFANLMAGKPSRVVLREANSLVREICGSRLRMWLARVAYRHAVAVIFVSEEQSRQTSRVLDLSDQVKKITIMNVVTDRELLRKAALQPEIAIPWRDKQPIFLSAGRMTEQKDFRTLINAFALLRKRMSCHLILLGTGPLESVLRSQVVESGLAGDIWMPGYVSNPFSYMALADVVVLSSIYEGCPNVLVQAIALRKPCVSTRCDFGPAELLGRYDGGFLVEVGDDGKMAQSMEAALAFQGTVNQVSETSIELKFDSFVSRYEHTLIRLGSN